MTAYIASQVGLERKVWPRCLLSAIIIDCKNHGCSIRGVTHWFGDCCFEASSLDFGRCHLGFLEPEATIFIREGGVEPAQGIAD